MEQDRSHESVTIWEQHTLPVVSNLNQSGTGATIRAVTGTVKMRQNKEGTFRGNRNSPASCF